MPNEPSCSFVALNSRPRPFFHVSGPFFQGERPPRPRLLTLGADTEALRREGQRLEHAYGRDRGNGWAYNHALGKARTYTEATLRRTTTL